MTALAVLLAAAGLAWWVLLSQLRVAAVAVLAVAAPTAPPLVLVAIAMALTATATVIVWRALDASCWRLATVTRPPAMAEGAP